MEGEGGYTQDTYLQVKSRKGRGGGGGGGGGKGLIHRTPNWTVKDVRVKRVRSRLICREVLMHRTPNWTVKDVQVEREVI